MQLQAWIDRLGEQTDLEIKGAAELAAAQRDNRRDCTYVLPGSERALPSDLANDIRQLRLITVSVVLAVDNKRPDRGTDGVSELEVSRAKIQTALLGWEPEWALGPVSFVQGRLAEFESQRIWWQEEWEVKVLTTL